nr:polysaccharide biosynthesis C-terminal domain-containing protein [Lunatimonas sp.]
MFGEAFNESTPVLRILIPGVLILTVYKVMYVDLAGKGKPWIALYAMIPSLFVNLFLNIYLIPKYGAYGAAISSTISYSIGGILFLVLYSLETKIPIKQLLAYQSTDIAPIIKLLRKN